METCERCLEPIPDDDLRWAEQFICAATLSSPEEWEGQPFHTACFDIVVEQEERANDPHEACWSKALANRADDYS